MCNLFCPDKNPTYITTYSTLPLEDLYDPLTRAHSKAYPLKKKKKHKTNEKENTKNKETLKITKRN